MAADESIRHQLTLDEHATLRRLLRLIAELEFQDWAVSVHSGWFVGNTEVIGSSFDRWGFNSVADKEARIEPRAGANRGINDF